jgi:hypothetical protein
MIARMRRSDRTILAHARALALLVVVATVAACGDGGGSSSSGLTADAIPVAHTPPGGYGDAFPAPVLADCTEPLVAGAPDLRGMWKAAEVTIGGEPAPPGHPGWTHFQRIEQCGDRIVITGNGVIHDMRADGTEEHGVHDVLERDYMTPIVVVASYEDGVHVLRPVGLPGVEVRRRRDGAQIVFDYLGGLTIRLERTGAPESAPPTFA